MANPPVQENDLMEPIALIGMGCRFPGGANTPEAFWQLLHDGVDAVTEIPATRWNVAEYYDPDPTVPGKMYVHAGAFLDAVDQFDPAFFHMTPREASHLDPQQRLLLEVTWEALEYAGLAPAQLAGSQTGVFVGSFSDDYSVERLYRAPVQHLNTLSTLSGLRSMVAGRIAHALDLHGPTLQIDTACSSSLLAVHLACQSLHNRECNLALAGGVSLILAPELLIGVCKMNALSADGRCKTFAANADGFGRGEGCGVVVLKRLSDAHADGDTILALIRGSATNHDGRSLTLTTPDSLAQQGVVRQALANAQLEPQQVQYIEAHGTGTPLGDPIELSALGKIFGQNRQTPLFVGSVKTNIGHLDPAAGVSSLIKVVLSLKHSEIPPHLHFNRPNPLIPWHKLPITVPTQLTPWQGQPKIAGISAFGMSGTNVHLLVEEAPQRAALFSSLTRPYHLLTLSARNEKALADLVQRYTLFLATNQTAALADICYTAAVGRSHFDQRLAVVAESTAQLQAQLTLALNGERPLGATAHSELSREASGAPSLIAFLFTGQGSQYVGMGRELYETQPTFRATLERCAEILRPLLGRSILEVLYPEDLYTQKAPTVYALQRQGALGDGSATQGRIEEPAFSNHHPRVNRKAEIINQTLYTQPALFVLEYALATLWRAWGVQPDILIGHSVGELAAACVAGVFSLEDALRLVAARARLMNALPQDGAMVAVAATEERVRKALAPYAHAVSIAAVNAPESMVISGQHQVVLAFAEQLASEGVKTQPLTVSHAFHSPLMEPMLDAFRQVAITITYHKPNLRLISNVTGKLAGDEIATPDYWVRHIRKAVRFAAGVQTLTAQGVNIFLEIGPKPTLLSLVEQNRAAEPLARAAHYLPSLREHQSDWQQMLTSLGTLYVQGVPIDWHGFDQAYQRQKVVLPTYPFQRQRYWLDTPKSKPYPQLRPLIDKMMRLPIHQETVCEAEFSLAALPFLADHQVYGRVVSPAACQLAMVLNAATLIFGQEQGVCLENVILPQALVIPDATARTVQTVLSPLTTTNNEPRQAFKLISFDAGAPQEIAVEEPATHATGNGGVATARRPGTVDLGELRQHCDQVVDIAAFYQAAAAAQLELGPTFRWVAEAWQGRDSSTTEILGKLVAPNNVNHVTDHLLPPGLLDACFQMTSMACNHSTDQATMLPFAMQTLHCYQPAKGDSWWCHAILAEKHKWDIQLLDEQGLLVATIDGFEMRAAPPEAVRGPTAWYDWLYTVAWQPSPAFGRRPAYLSTPATVVAQLQQASPARGAEASNDQTQRWQTALDELSCAYVLAAFAQVGFPFQPGAEWRTEQIARQSGVLPTYHRLLTRLLALLAEEGILQPVQERWRVVKTPAPADPAARLAALHAAYGQTPELALLARCGAQLSAVWRGVQEPLELLFPGGDTSMATQLYTDTPNARTMNRLVQQVVQQAVAHLPAGRGLRIVELGAGTGGTTAGVLPLLPADRTDYCFTDIGAAFLPKAQARFAAYGFVRYQPLDIEQAPTAQGFARHQADLVIAAQVLHATKDIGETLTHVRQLLQPGGQVLLVEATQPSRWVDLTFGLTAGWWRFADDRQAHPLLTADQWRTRLLAHGFQAVEVMEQAGQAFILAQADGHTPAVAQTEAWVIFADTQGVGEAVAAHLRQQGATAFLIFAHACYAQPASHTFHIRPDYAEDYQRVLTTVARAGSPLHGVVHLWSLDVPQLQAETNLIAAAQQSCGTALHLAQALLQQQVEPGSLWLVTRDAQAVTATDAVTGIAQVGLWGLGKVIALEHPELNCISIDLDATATPDAQAAHLYAEITAAATEEKQENQIALRQDARYVARLTRHQTVQGLATPAGPYRLEIAERGTLDQIQLRPMARRVPVRGEVEIQVQASGLNFRDVLNALGMYPGDPGPLGLECAGVVVAVGADVTQFAVGDAVLALASASFGHYITVNTAAVIHKPASLSTIEAATIPGVFLTAYYGLHHLAQMKAGDRVLIHAATGGVGMAAIQLAQQVGAEVWGTASPGKWETLRQLGVTHIYNSRTVDFAEQVMADTNGAGVGIILNSLTGPGFIEANLAALAPGGYLVEMSKRDVWSAEQVAAVRPDVRYARFDLREIGHQHPERLATLFSAIRDLFTTNKLRPLPATVFPIQEAIAAFGYMQQAKHIGKIVLTIPAVDAHTIQAQATYLITGGLSGLGLAVAQWLAEQGARHLLLVGRSRPKAEVQPQLDALAALGVTINIAQTDVTSFDAMRLLLEQIDVHYPLRGVIHSVGVLDDGALLQQSWDRFAKVLAPKLQGAWHLHELTKDGGPAGALDFFVLFSSVTSLLGNRGQANHAAANAFLDAFVHYRRARGLPALSINWGAWSEIGAAAALVRENRQQMAAQGMGFISPEQGIQAFAYLLNQHAPQVGVAPINWQKFQVGDPAANAFYANFMQSSPVQTIPVQTSLTNLRQQLAEADEEPRHHLLLAYLCTGVAKILGLRNPEQIDPRRGLLEMGLDSLMAIELRNQLARTLEQQLPSTLIFDYPTVEKLHHFLLQILFEPEAERPAKMTEISGTNERKQQVVNHDIAALSVDALIAQVAEDFETLQ